jgi:hypothetical protein
MHCYCFLSTFPCLRPRKTRVWKGRFPAKEPLDVLPLHKRNVLSKLRAARVHESLGMHQFFVLHDFEHFRGVRIIRLQPVGIVPVNARWSPSREIAKAKISLSLNSEIALAMRSRCPGFSVSTFASSPVFAAWISLLVVSTIVGICQRQIHASRFRRHAAYPCQATCP